MVYFDEKLIPCKFRVNGKISGGKFYYGMVLRVDLKILVTVDIHHGTGINQKNAEDVEYPMKMTYKRRTQKNKGETHYYSAYYAPKKYFMVMLLINSKRCKNEYHYKYIINR